MNGLINHMQQNFSKMWLIVIDMKKINKADILKYKLHVLKAQYNK